MKRDKRLHLEILRVIAIFFVIFNHTEVNGFFLFSKQELGSIPYFGYMFLSIFCKFSVPLFLCISGALLLKKDETIKTIVYKRVLRIIVILLTFSFVAYLQYTHLNNVTFSLKEFIKKMYVGNWNGSYWYLDIYIVFLLSLPFMRSMVKSLDLKYYYYMMSLMLLYSGFIPVVQYLFLNGEKLNSNLKLEWLLTTIVFYPLLGYCMEYMIKIEGPRFKRNLIFIWLINILTIVCCCMLTFHRHKKLGYCNEWDSQTFHMTFVFVNVITLYLTMKYICNKIRFNKYFENIILSLGENVFGIYLLHIIIMRQPRIKAILVFFKEDCNLNHMVSVLLYCLCVFVLCYVITLLLKKIPVIKKFV